MAISEYLPSMPALSMPSLLFGTVAVAVGVNLAVRINQIRNRALAEVEGSWKFQNKVNAGVLAVGIAAGFMAGTTAVALPAIAAVVAVTVGLLLLTNAMAPIAPRSTFWSMDALKNLVPGLGHRLIRLKS